MKKIPSNWREHTHVRKFKPAHQPAPSYRGAALGDFLRKALEPCYPNGCGFPDMAIVLGGKTVPRLRLLRHESSIDERGVIHLVFRHANQPWRDPIYLHFDPRFGPVRRGIKTPRLTNLTVGYPTFGSIRIHIFEDPEGKIHEVLAA